MPFDALPMAAAGLDAAGVILDTNRRFRRLFKLTDRSSPSPVLPELIAVGDRRVLEEALDRLRGQAGWRQHRVIAAPVDAPLHRLAIQIVRVGISDGMRFLVFARPGLRGSWGRARPRPSPIDPLGIDPRGFLTDRPTASPWLTTLAHELRGPLSAIQGWATMAEAGVRPAGGVPHALRIIRRNAESLSALVENVLDLSRTMRGRLALSIERLDLNHLAGLVVESAYPAARRREVTLAAECAAAPIIVQGDRLRLEQVVRNLVDNAIKFTSAGGAVRLRTACREPFAECVVDDTGAGIPADVLPSLFDPALRRAPDVSPSAAGLGLGLLLVREIVRLHHGELSAASPGAGRGSTFLVRLPLAPIEHPPA